MKQIRWLVAPCVLVVAATLVHGGGDKGKEKGNLEGKWVADFKDLKFEMTFAKDTFTLVVGKDAIKGTFKTDASKKPRQLDMVIKEGPDAKSVGKTALCIYEVEGDTLKWCAGDPVKGTARPKAFPAKVGDCGDDPIYLVFKRAAK